MNFDIDWAVLEFAELEPHSKAAQRTDFRIPLVPRSLFQVLPLDSSGTQRFGIEALPDIEAPPELASMAFAEQVLDTPPGIVVHTLAQEGVVGQGNMEVRFHTKHSGLEAEPLDYYQILV